MKNISKTNQRAMLKMYRELSQDYLNSQNTFSYYVSGIGISESLIEQQNKKLQKFKLHLEDE